MSNPPDRHSLLKTRRRKNWATLGALVFLVVLLYLVAIVRMSGL